MSQLAYELELPPLSPLASVAPVASLGLARAQRAVDENRFEDALDDLRNAASPATLLEHSLRSALLESWASLELGHVDAALELAERAHEIASGPRFTDTDRAEALHHLGCARFKRAEISLALSLLTVALDLCDRSEVPCDRLRTSVLEWRSRCYQSQREWDFARSDVERALELAIAVDDPQLIAHAYFQASLVAERTGDQLLARFYAEEAATIYRSLDDRRMLPRILTNLGGLLFLLDDEIGALLHLDEAIQIAVEEGSHESIAQAVSSTAQIHLRQGRPELAEERARTALEALARRVDVLPEVGNVQLLLGRALLDQSRFDEAGAALREAESSFRQLGSTSHVAAVWVAQGDLLSAQGDCTASAERYRAAAESLQDIRF